MSDRGTLDPVFKLSSRIRVLPIRHGSGDIAQEVRETLLAHRIDCLAVPLPPSVQETVEQAIAQLPFISLVVMPEPNREETLSHSFIPVDPCQAVIMGIRVAMSERMARAYIDREVTVFEPASYFTPDPYALKKVSLAAYASAILPFLPAPQSDSQQWRRIAWMAFRLHELEIDYESILCLCAIEDWPWLRTAYQDRASYHPPEVLEDRPAHFSVSSDSLYFMLGELPYLTALYERRREEARADTHLSIDGIKELLLDSRTRWLAKRSMEIAQEPNWVTPLLVQSYLQYVRNLALIERRFTPDLYTLVLAAKQMAGDEFALTLLETANSYVYQDSEKPSWGTPELTMGLGELAFSDGAVSKAKNRLEGQPVVWRSLSLRPTPPKPKKRNWAYEWNPYQQCSWPPEDTKIEAFRAHVCHQARTLLGADLARIEKFTTSFRDGIDLRETLRHWKSQKPGHVQDIYIKEIPPARGSLEVFVFLFQVPSDPEKYSWRATWYAEHEQESTLSFYATPFLENMIGPGIGQSSYGGAMFLFPPRMIPDIWEDPRFHFAQTLEERLLAGACFHSREMHVALVSPIPPKGAWRQIARRFNRKIIPIPLKRFSGQTIHQLRHFHVLNGHNIRSYAAQFIRE